MKQASSKHPKKRYIWLAVAVGTALAAIFILVLRDDTPESADTAQGSGSSESRELVENGNVPRRLTTAGLDVDFSKASVDLQKVLSGGPGKDGIPALTDPIFESQANSTVADDVQVMVVEHNGEVKIYPYSILVWHEIVNDDVGGKPLAVTFCPLCGSAIVFEREIDAGEVVDFGVSGFLYESNMVMYSREEPESLFSQSLGEAIIGARTGQQLTLFPMQLMTYAEAKTQFPEAQVLSDDTGHSRNYTTNPYGDYDETDTLYFQVSNTDNRFPGKEVFYIVRSGDGRSVAIQQGRADGSYDIPDTNIIVSFEKGRIIATENGTELPGYFEMWFSWATHNQADGIVFAN